MMDNTRMRQAGSFAMAVWVGLACTIATADGESMRWWPAQKAPRGLVYTSFSLLESVPDKMGRPVPVGLGQEHMMVESVAGLVALAVNEGRLDELIWLNLDNPDYERWRAGLVSRLELEERGIFKPWDLVSRYRDKGVIKGYILYQYDCSEGNVTEVRPGSDESVNVATSLAGILGGMVVDESLEEKAREQGLPLLLDVRGKTEAWCFENYRDRLNRDFALAQDPRMPNVRDIAVANRMMVFFGTDSPTPEIYAWLNPLSSILGWNGGDEGRFVEQLSRHGHILLPNNWSLNVTATSAGSEQFSPKPFMRYDPSRIDWTCMKNAVAFVMSDGDNVQWFEGDFFGNRDYWASPDHGAFPMGWGTPYACLAQCAPDALLYLQQTQRPDTTLNLHAGGYYYPDLLGVDRTPEIRAGILARHAQRLNHYMQRTGGTTLMFLCMDIESPGALQAYEVFAREIDCLTGMFVIQYAPYEAGDGKAFWVKNKRGVEIPVVSAKYAIWANLNHPRAGTPAKIARLVNEAAPTAPDTDPLLCWTITHTWSGFKRVSDADDQSENAAFRAPDTHAAVTPTKWCVDRLAGHVRVVSPEELLWRIRMRHDPSATLREIAPSSVEDVTLK